MTFSFGTTPVYVSEGQTIRLKFKAPSAWDTTQSVTVQIGDQQTIWYISTVPEDFAPDPFPFTPLDEATPDVMYVYGDGTRAQEDIIEVSGLTPGSSASVSLVSSYLGTNIDEYSVRIQLVHQGEADFGNWVIPTSNIFVQNGDRLQLRLKSNDTGGLTRTADLTIGARTERWTITSAIQPPNIPEPFPDFNEITGAPVDVDVYSEILRVTGLNAQAVVNTDNGARIGISASNAFVVNDQGYSVLDGVTFAESSTNPTIQNGEYLQLVLTTPATSTTTVTNLLSIGDAVAGSSWGVTTGSFPSTTPQSFVFTDEPSAEEDALIASDIQPVGGLTGLGAGVSVPVTLISTDGTEPRVKIYYDNGSESSVGIFPTDVSNGDSIQIYNRSSATFSATVQTTIKVGTRQIPTWSIVTNSGPDTEADFTAPASLTNKAPNRQYVSSVVSVTGINRDITIAGTNNVLISIDFDTPVVGPRTFTPSNSSVQFYLTSGGLASTVSTTIAIGTGNSNQFTWNVSTYAVAPPPPELVGTWYSRKNSYTYEDSNGDLQLRNSKDDGLAIGTILSVLKQPGGGYGTIDGELDSRYPGFIECDGRSLSKALYGDLFAVIGYTYGGSGATFNLPDYRNRKLTGCGVVDGNRASSAFLPTNNINEPGNIGGWWYIDKVDVAGDNPFEQIIGTGNTGNESNFFNFGTVKTQFNAPIQADIEFAVNGTVTAQIGQLQEKLIDVPVHTHLYVSAITSDVGSTGLIPWDTQVLASPGAFENSTPTGTTGLGDGPYVNFIGGGGTDELFREEPENWYNLWIGELDAVVGRTDFKTVWDQILLTNKGVNFKAEILEWAGTWPASPLGEGQPAAKVSRTLSAKVWWASPFNQLDPNDLESLNPALNNMQRYPEGVYGQDRTGQTAVSAAIDVEGRRFRIEAYTPPAILEDSDTTTSSHNHLMGLTPVLDPTQDFSYGNQNGPGSFKEGLGSFGSTLNVTFDNNQFNGNTAPVGLILNTGTFELNQNIKKPIPSVTMQPNRQVPVIEEFHKVKYIIKAY